MLARPEPPVHADARALLGRHNITVEKIVAVNPESILYLGASKRAFTAWVSRTEDGLNVAYEAGFPAFPTPGLTPEHRINPA